MRSFSWQINRFINPSASDVAQTNSSKIARGLKFLCEPLSINRIKIETVIGRFLASVTIPPPTTHVLCGVHLLLLETTRLFLFSRSKHGLLLGVYTRNYTRPSGFGNFIAPFRLSGRTASRICFVREKGRVIATI